MCRGFPRVQPQQLGFDTAVGLGHRLGQALPLGAQLHAARPAQEQPVAQALFQLAHLLADRARGDVQLFGAAGEGQVPGCAGKYMQPDEHLTIELSSHRLVPLKACLGGFVGHP